MKAIPTEYGGCRFRSRLEARWAAFFDLCRWHWTYEPFDLDGWIPDFALHSVDRKIAALVEIKPLSPGQIAKLEKRSQFMGTDLEKILPHARECGVEFGEDDEPSDHDALKPDILVLGSEPLCLTHYGSEFSYLGVLVGYECWSDCDFDLAAFGVREGGGFDFYPEVGSYRPRIHMEPHKGVRYRGDHVTAFWRKAGNLVQWKAPVA